ncbi:hypothetical protein [Undibacterium sp. RuRC25W]|uniref:hypothetical protein n=1 Tax=Undibacterium sp. RuRC25W TaxID=3413047 RepID=UPI003BEFF44A
MPCCTTLSIYVELMDAALADGQHCHSAVQHEFFLYKESPSATSAHVNADTLVRYPMTPMTRPR